MLETCFRWEGSRYAAADALIVKHGNAVLVHCRMWVDKDVPESLICNTVEYLVSKGADIRAKDKRGATLLHRAAYGTLLSQCFDNISAIR